MWHTFNHFIHMQYFLLPTNLVIVFVHWVSTVVCCTNPENVHCFGTIFPNLNFVFASICAARPTNTTEVAQLSTKSTTWRRAIGAPGIHPDWEQPKTALWLLSSRNNMISTRTNEGKQRWFKVTRELCHEWFHHFRHHVHDGHWTGEFAAVSWRLHCFTVSFRGDVRGESGPR